MSRTRSRRRGFTLMEVLLVLVILVVLGSLSVSILTGTRKRANINAAKSQVTLLKSPIDLYFSNTGQYPPTLEALYQGLQDPYCDPVPLDPWGGQYKITAPGTHNPSTYDVWSSGPDGQDGSEDDIGNW